MGQYFPADRLVGYLAEMADAKKLSTLTEEQSGAEKPVKEFSVELAKRMLSKGISIPALVAAVNARGNVEIDEQRIKSLRSTGGLSSPTSAKKPEEIFEIAQALGCEVMDFFPSLKEPKAADDPPDESDDIEEAFRMCRKGLQGPKAKFLLDAIEMAYTAAIMSKRNH